VSQQELKI